MATGPTQLVEGDYTSGRGETPWRRGGSCVTISISFHSSFQQPLGLELSCVGAAYIHLKSNGSYFVSFQLRLTPRHLVKSHLQPPNHFKLTLKGHAHQTPQNQSRTRSKSSNRNVMFKKEDDPSTIEKRGAPAVKENPGHDEVMAHPLILVPSEDAARFGLSLAICCEHCRFLSLLLQPS